MSTTPPSYRAEADREQTTNEVEARQATEKPRGMPIVLVVSTVGAAVVLFAIWALYFG
jgi:hypothetical protein